MQRFSVSLDDDLADWVESQADTRGVSKAKVIRDAVALAQETGLQPDQFGNKTESIPLTTHLENIEARLNALEQYPQFAIAQPEDDSPPDKAGILALFEHVLEERPPETAHGTAAVLDVFIILLEEGPMKTEDLREAVYSRHESEFTDARTMWQSIQRHFNEIPGIQKVGYAEWDANPTAVIEATPDRNRF